MTRRKARLTVTVDSDLVDAGNEAVAEGRAGSLSGWVNTALADRARLDAKLAALRRAIADYEAEYGVIPDAEMEAVARADRESALVVRGSSSGSAGRSTDGRSGAA